MTIGAPKGMIFSSMQSMNIRRIEAGILDSGSDFDMTMTPFEAGLDRFVDLDKVGFIGRDALVDAKRGKRLYGVLCRDLTSSAGCRILDGNAEVGFVSTGAQSPYLEAGIGYVRFDRGGDWAGSTLSMRCEAFGDTKCEIVELPFYDREKAIPRAKVPHRSAVSMA